MLFVFLFKRKKKENCSYAKFKKKIFLTTAVLAQNWKTPLPVSTLSRLLAISSHVQTTSKSILRFNYNSYAVS